MKRPVGVIPAAIVQAVVSVLVLSFAITKLVVLSNLPATYDPEHQPAMSSDVPLETAILCGLLSVFGLLAAIGLLRMRVWARYATLIFAGLLVVAGLVMALVFAFMPIPETTTPEAEFVAAKGVLTALSLVVTVVGVFWLRYFSRRRIKAVFAHTIT